MTEFGSGSFIVGNDLASTPAADAGESVSAKAGARFTEEAHSSVKATKMQVAGAHVDTASTIGSAADSTSGGGKPQTELDPNFVNVSVYLKSKASDQEIEHTLERIASGQQSDYSQDPQGFDAKFGADPKSLAQVEKFAATNHLKVTSADLDSGLVVLSGEAKDFGTAFGIFMSYHQNLDGQEELRHSGPIPVPASLEGSVVGVFGLDPLLNGQVISDTVRDRSQHESTSGESIQSYMPNEVAALYHFPMQTGGGGQGVAILEFDGGFDRKDSETYYKEHGLPIPQQFNIISVDGGTNHPDAADDEVALDSQIVGAVAPRATQNISFAPNTKQGFIDSVTRATFQPPGETRNAAVSMSWGLPEQEWEPDASAAMRLAIQKAALKGINVFIASGDSGAKDGSSDGSNQAQFPTSVPEAIGVGGTTLESKNGRITSETAWNGGYSSDFFGNKSITATGGGFSEKYSRPFYQSEWQSLDGTKHRDGRGVPDIAGDADDRTGYKIRVDGSDRTGNGTSAATPLYAAFNALINAENGGKSWGWLLPKIYEFGKVDPQVFNDITSGENDAYKATKGWDPLTGWGSINGTAFLAALQQETQKQH